MSVSTLAFTERTAACDHTCWGCGGTIGQGDRYADWRCADEGRAYTLRLHRICDALYTEAQPDEYDWSIECGQEALFEWARGFVNALAPAGAS